MQQRILALLLLLFTIVIVSISPSLIQAVFEDTSDLKTRIELLEEDVRTQDSTIRANRRSCTDEIIRREKEILDQIADLEDRMKRSKNQKMLIRESTGMDTVQIKVIDNSDMMMKGLSNIKSEIEKDMKKRK